MMIIISYLLNFNIFKTKDSLSLPQIKTHTMKKALLMLAFTGLMAGTAFAANGDDKDKAKAKKECCKKGEGKSCAGEKKESCDKGEAKACCKKKAEASTETKASEAPKNN